MSQASKPSGSESSTCSRRGFLALSLGALAALQGCDSSNPAQGLVRDLPESGSEELSLSPGQDVMPYYPPPVGPSPVKRPPINNNAPIPPSASSGIIPRSVWARGTPNLKTIDPMDGVRFITFHHSGDPKPFLADNFWDTALHLEYVREYHMSRKFQDIGYHFAIDRAGRIWQLRSLRYQGQHVRYHNEHNIGVVVLGNFEQQEPTSQQKERIRTFGQTLRSQYDLPIKRVYTHQEIVSTECPGDHMQPYMVYLRRNGLI